MKRKSILFSSQFQETMTALNGDGLLLAATKPGGESNVMTIGWGTIGSIWGLPMFLVVVRPTRYTYQFIEASNEFTVNVPTPAIKEFTHHCGTASGRDGDKFARFQMSVTPGQKVQAVTIDACPLVYECRVVHKNDILPATLDPTLDSRYYPGGDYHRVYYGEILGAFAAE